MHAFDSLLRKNEFARLFRRGTRSSQAHFVIYALPARSTSGRARVGVSVPKLVGKAVARNLVRRRILGTLDAMNVRAYGDAQLVFVAKAGAADTTYAVLAAEIQNGVRHVLERSRAATR